LVQASSGGSTGDVTGPGSSDRPREGRPAPSSQGRVEGRLRPQRRNSGGPQAQAAGLRHPVHRATPKRGTNIGGGRSYPHGPRPTQGVEGDRGQGRIRGTRQLGHSLPQITVWYGERHQHQ
ncbi:unnamed protein product, partial [Ascophyllum nodosum]